jgi:hypothetical protein
MFSTGVASLHKPALRSSKKNVQVPATYKGTISHPTKRERRPRGSVGGGTYELSLDLVLAGCGFTTVFPYPWSMSGPNHKHPFSTVSYTGLVS